MVINTNSRYCAVPLMIPHLKFGWVFAYILFVVLYIFNFVSFLFFELPVNSKKVKNKEQSYAYREIFLLS